MKQLTGLAVMLIAALALFAGDFVGSSQSSIPDRDVPRLVTKLRGYIANDGVLMSSKYVPMWVQRAVSDFSGGRETHVPATLEVRNPLSHCLFVRPSPDHKVVHAFVGGSWQKSAVYVYDDDIVREKAARFIEKYKNKGRKLAEAYLSSPEGMSVTDVVITDTSQPLYLVLTSQSARLWNIQVARGVKIAHVAVMSNRHAGIANLAKDIPIEFLTYKKLKACGVFPLRRPKDHWSFVRNAKASGDTKLINKNIQGHLKFAKFFRSRFGASPEANAVEVNVASHVLIGDVAPTLEGRVPHKPITGSHVVLTAADNVTASKQSVFTAKFEKQVIDLASQMAGGDLSVLEPAS
ncbi:MAG: hypothetical protein AAF468_01240 [Pseudomonadota bacterium]